MRLKLQNVLTVLLGLRLSSVLALLLIILACSESVPTPDIEKQAAGERLEAARDELVQVNQELLDNVFSSEGLLDETFKLQASMTFHKNHISRSDCTGISVIQSPIPPSCGQYWASVRSLGPLNLELKETEAQKEDLIAQRRILKIRQSELGAEIRSLREKLTIP